MHRIIITANNDGCLLKHVLLSLVLLCILSSCTSKQRFPYAIRDFKNSLRPYLISKADKGVVRYDSITMHIADNTTERELLKLARCEHPVLRATALSILGDRKSIDSFELVMDHLDDSAIVPTYAGEFGIWYRMVSDELLDNSTWATEEDRNKTLDKVLLQHNYLRCAYRALKYIEPQEKYYASIKEMANRDWNFYEYEYALYGLAKFKKREDIPFIKKQLLSMAFFLDDYSFRLMTEYPDSSYMEVFERYKRSLNSFLCEKDNSRKFEYYIRAVGTYKNEKSAAILQYLLNKLPFKHCLTHTELLKSEVEQAIWNNPCEAYKELWEQVRPVMEKYGNNILELPPLPYDGPEKIYWYR